MSEKDFYWVIIIGMIVSGILFIFGIIDTVIDDNMEVVFGFGLIALSTFVYQQFQISMKYSKKRKSYTQDLDYSFWSKVVVLTIILGIAMKLIWEAIFIYFLHTDPLDLFQNNYLFWLGSFVSGFLASAFIISEFERIY